MEQIIVTHLDTTTLKLNSAENISRIIKAEQTVELLGQDVVNITVESARKLTFSLGDKITVVGRDYTLNTPPVERKFSETRFTYELQFEGVQYDMLRASFSVNVDTTNNQIQDLSGNSLTGNMKLFLDVLMANLNRVFPGKWVLGVYPTETETRTETFSDTDNCLSVLQTLCSQDKFNTEFDIEISQAGVRTLNIRQTGKIHAHTFSYGKGKGVYELSRQKVSNSNIINRLWVFGGSKNILTTRYRAFKLCLPLKGKGSSYLEDAASIAKYGVWEGTKNFEDIYPSRTGSVTALGADELEFIDNSMDFDLNETDVNDNTLYLMAGAKAKIRFKTGNLAGFEFEIESYDHAIKKFRLLSQTDENDYTFPSPDSAAFRFSVTDQYTITDIALPQSYETAAEQKLEDAGEAYLAKFSQPLVSYGLRLDPRFLRDIAGEDVDSNIIWVGDFIPVLDTDLDVDKTIRVKGFTRDLMNPFAYDITIADLTVTTTTISRVITDLNDVVNVIKINNLKDPARARRNWLAAQELLNMVFDVEGDYYTDKIKPASIDTIMLSVGAKSMQFGLIGTVFQPNYAGNANRIVYRGGTLQHYTIDPNGAKSWTLTDGDVTFPLSTTAYYIYAKVERSGTAGSILFSTSQISVEQDGSYYHFWIGVISSVDSLLNTRLISLTYGFTTINGRYISTGRIQSADGLTYFDLDQGVIQGTLKFSSGQSVEDAIQEAVETNSFWSIMASSPVIYKDAASAAISGSHTSVVLTGELTVGNSTSYGGYISVTPNGGTESSPQASPVTLQPANADGKTSYLIKLYDDAVKTTLLDSMTIPVVFKGATGVSAINVVQSNEADVLPASVDGVVSSYVGSGNIIRVFEGSTELSYDGIGTAAGKFNVTGVGTNVTVGTKATSGNGVSFGVVSGMNADLAYITFTISGKTAAGTAFSFSKVQNFSKARAGATGADGPQGVAGPAGSDGVTLYTWIRYADDEVGTGISNSPVGKEYIGFAYNKTTDVESNTASDYTWSLIKGDQGIQGIPGPAGTNGTTYYTWIKYADTPTSGISDYPAGKAYLGVAHNKTTATESTNYADYTWSLIKGEQGIQGPAGADGVTTYTWIKYSDNADGTGLYDVPTSNTLYVGIAVNKTTATESTNKADYTWSKFRGDQGVPGPAGVDGQTTYTWIKYSDNADGTGLYDVPTANTQYIGIAVNKTTQTESTLKTDYTWSRFKGEQGVQGIAGPAGADGVTYYTWVKYADTPTTGMSDYPSGKAYLGIAYNKTTPTESTNYADYSWSLIKGEQGIQGPAGTNGVTTYTWIKYSDYSDGTSLYDTPTANTQYIGIAVNKTTATESTVKTDYTWSKFKGDQGVKGDKGDQGIQGIPGVAGADGVTYYTWVKYADTPTTGISDYPSGKAYLGIAHNKTTATESTNYADYTWSLIKGEQGVVGPAGADGVTTYTWIKYSNYSDGTSLYDVPTSATLYIGIAVNKTTATESTNKADYTWSRFRGYDGSNGTNGTNGISVTSVVVEYAQSVSATVAPTTGWSSTAPAWLNGYYIWARTTTHFSDNSYSTTTPVNVTGGKGETGSTGATGSAGRGVSNVQEEYYLSTSDSTQTGGSWSTTPPAWQEGKYIWTRIKVTYVDPVGTGYTTAVLASEWTAIQQAQLAADGYMNARYVRDWLSGWTDENGSTGTDKRFNEIQVFLKAGTNIAQGKTVTSNGTNNASYPLTRVTDGNTTNYAIPTIGSTTACYVQVDLGKVYYDISHIIVFHDSSNGKTFNGTKTEISMDGVNWVKIYDSSTQGLYKEGLAGNRLSMLKTELYSKTVEAKAKTDFMTTIDGGLIYTALMKLFDTQGLNETAFISGQQGSGQDLPAFGAGGTYANALALSTFLSKMISGTTPSAGEYDQLPQIVMLHNGAAKIGDFIVEESGRIVLVDPSTGKPRQVFSVSDLPTLATLASGTTYGSTINFSATTTTTSKVLTGSISVTQDGASINFQASLLEISASANAGDGLYPAASAVVELLRNGSYYRTLGSVGIHVPYGGSNYASGSINQTITGCPVGTYTVRFIAQGSPEIYSKLASISASSLSWSFVQSGVRYMQMGLNGLMAYFSNNHLYFTENGGLDVRGATNMPGILLSGVVGSAGGFNLWWGAKKAAGTCTRTATGTYTVYHDVGHTLYSVLITCEWGPFAAHVLNKGTTSFDVKLYRTDGTSALVNTEFSFAIVGNNYP